MEDDTLLEGECVTNDEVIKTSGNRIRALQRVDLNAISSGSSDSQKKRTDLTGNQKEKEKDISLLQTKLCKAVSVVVGTTPEVQNLDQARRLHKSKPNNIVLANDYQTKLALVQSKVLAEQCKLKKKFEEWEKEFFVTHNCLLVLPEEINNDATAKELKKKIVYADGLLNEWKMDALGCK